MTRRVSSLWHRTPSSWPEAAQYKLPQRPFSAPCATSVRRVTDHGFRFAGLARALSCPEDWNPPRGVRALWAEQLHSFRWIWEVPPGDAAAWITRWLDDHPPLSSPGWRPYPLCARVREWIEWLLAHPDAPGELRSRMLVSLAHQVRVLEDLLEDDAPGEHLLENAITLCWAGLNLYGPSSSRWLASGRRVLMGELGQQVLRDGTHDSRSPMIQAQLAETLLRFAEAAGFSSIAQQVRDSARAAGEVFVRTLQLLTHPDGEVALLNDSVFGEAPTARELKFRFRLPAEIEDDNEHVWSLPAAGYFGLRGRGPYMVLDAGPLAPEARQHHGHADALSFELSHDGRRLLTDSGVHTYDTGELRERDRGTAAHNTIQVDGLDQSELSGAFGSGRRIRRASGEATSREGVDRLAGAYIGRALRATVQHTRECRVEGDWLRFTDRLSARGAHEAVLRLHVAPGLSVADSQDGPRVLDSGLPLALVQGHHLEWTLEESPYHPELGKELVRPCLFSRVGFADQLTLEWGIRLL